MVSEGFTWGGLGRISGMRVRGAGRVRGGGRELRWVGYIEATWGYVCVGGLLAVRAADSTWGCGSTLGICIGWGT